VTTAPLPAGAITSDHWLPPALSGPPSETNFCVALTAIYRHMADLARVYAPSVSEQYLNDYATFAPTVEGEAPPGISDSARTYIGAVAAYLHELAAAGMQMSRLPAGALQGLSAPAVSEAFTALSTYSTTNCHYTIGGTAGG
jgi:hypothetical protein